MFNLDDIKFFEDRGNLPLSHSFVIDSGIAGPTLVVLGAVHGNEPAGVKAAIEITKQIESGTYKLLEGKVIFVLANPEAYTMNVRFVEENMNRAFGQSLSPSIESQRAKDIEDFILGLDNVAGLIDLHSVSIGNFQLAVYPNLPGNKEVALEISDLSTHFCFLPELVTGTSSEILIEKAGVRSLCIECGNHNDPESVEVALQHIKKFLEYLHMADQTPIKVPQHHHSIVVYRTFDLIRPTVGFQFLDPSVHTGLHIEAGQAYAQDINGTIKADQDCYIVMPTKVPNPSDSDAGFLCAKEIYSTVPFDNT